MSKLKILKKMLAMSLATMSFMPAVGAVKGDGISNGEPPKKVSRIERTGKPEELFSGIAIKKILPKLWDGHRAEVNYKFSYGIIRDFVYLMHSIKEIRMAVLNDTGRDPKIYALNVLFRIIEGKDEYNDKIIENAYRILDPDDNAGEDLISLFRYLEKKYGLADKYNRVIDDIWWDEELDEEYLNLDEFIGPDNLEKNSAFITIGREEDSSQSSIREISNIKELTNTDNGDKFDLCYLAPLSARKDLYYIKHSDGKWYKYANESIEEVSEDEVLRVGACVDVNLVYNKRV